MDWNYICFEVTIKISFRFSEDIIVRNSMNEGEWGTEEREGGMPLKTGHEFTMTIVCEEDGYRISIDNKFFTFFNHRLPMESVYKLEVLGKVRLFKVTYQCSEVCFVKLIFLNNIKDLFFNFLFKRLCMLLVPYIYSRRKIRNSHKVIFDLLTFE